MKILRKLILVSLIFILANSFANVFGNGDDHHHHGGEHAIEDHCDNPTAELYVVTPLGEVSYDQESYSVPKNTCVKVIYQNKGIVEHDFNIDEIEGSEGIQRVHIHLANNTDGHNGDGISSQNIKTPDADTEFEIYCTVLGHREAGMEAVLIVGDGNSFLIIPPIFVFISFLSMILVRTIVRYKNK